MYISSIFKTLAEKIKKILWVLGFHAFSLILLIILIEVILGGFIFYKYVFLAQDQESKITENIIRFDDKTYQNVLEQLQARGQGIQEPLMPE